MTLDAPSSPRAATLLRRACVALVGEGSGKSLLQPSGLCIELRIVRLASASCILWDIMKSEDGRIG